MTGSEETSSFISPGNSSTSVQHTCNEVIFLPIFNESNWPMALRAFLYLLGMLWFFLGIAIVADVHMCAIEKITSATKKIKIRDHNTGVEHVKQVSVWNGTVANLTLMALGSSAPEILLSLGESAGSGFTSGHLGPDTIIGSAAFNLFIITAVCIMEVGLPNKRIKNISVFFTTSLISVFAYLWLLVILVGVTPDYVDLWEGVVTFLFFPVLVVFAYLVDIGGFRKVFIWTVEHEETSSDSDQQAEIPVIDADAIREFLANLGPEENLTDDEIVRLMIRVATDKQHHSRAWYRINATREMTGGHKLDVELDEKLEERFEHYEAAVDHTSSRLSLRTWDRVTPVVSHRSVVEFSASSYAVLECDGSVEISVCRHGNLDNSFSCRVVSSDGTATSNDDFIPIDKVLTFSSGVEVVKFSVEIIDDDEWEPDETFFVRLSLEEETEARINHDVVLGLKAITQVTILNDDEPGTFEFSRPTLVVKMSSDMAPIPVSRSNGCDGHAWVTWIVEAMSAVEGRDFIGTEGQLDFVHGETNKTIDLPIRCDDKTPTETSFLVKLTGTCEGAKLGSNKAILVRLVSDKEYKEKVDRLVNMVQQYQTSLSADKVSWADQFRRAMNVKGGDIESAKTFDYVMHFLTFAWKILFAIVPPPVYLGGWATYIISLTMMGMVTMIMGDLASLFGCMLSIRTAVTAITFVAAGTSLPDLFGSQLAARFDSHADNAIGNVMGSNSVNVFVGLGLPWMASSIYWTYKGSSFYVPAGDLAFSVILFTVFSLCAICLLISRRYLDIMGSGELGGPRRSKLVSCVVLGFLYFSYLLIASFKYYEFFIVKFY